MQSDLSQSNVYPRSLFLDLLNIHSTKVSLHSSTLSRQQSCSPLCHLVDWYAEHHSLDGSKVIPNVFCHQCKSYQCCHAPSVDTNGKFFYPLSIIGKPSSAPHPPIHKLLMISASTFNCLSMHEDTDEFDTAKVVTRQSLADAFNSMNCDFFGLLETRTVQREFQMPGYYCICSGSDNGNNSCNYGVELWIKVDSTIRVYDSLNNIYENIDIHPDQFIVVYREPRILLVTTEMLGQAVTFAVLHAPHQNHGTKDVKLCWSSFFQLLHSFNIKYETLILLGDFNQKFGSIVSTSIGDFFPQKQGPGAHCIHEWLIANNLCLPSTFQGKHDSSPARTYTHHTGSLHRIDYVCVPSVCLDYPCFTSTIDLGLTNKIDHCAALCSFCIPIQARCLDLNMRNGKRCYGYDHSAFSDPVKNAQFDAAISFCDNSAPFSNSSSRNHYVSTFVYQSLCEFFPLGKRSPIKPWISTESLSIIKSRKGFRFQINRAKLNGASPLVIKPIYDKWKHAAIAAKASLRDDYRQNITSKCTEAQTASDNADWRKFFQIKKSLSPKKGYSSTYMFSGDHVCVYYKDIRSASQKYFANLLDGKVLSLEEAMADLDSCQKLLASAGIPFPEWGKLRQLIKSSRPLTAAGPDGLKYIVLKYFPMVFDLYYEVMQDAFSGDGPLQWCGSILLELFKGKGNIHQFEMYRDILLADVVGKIAKKYVRNTVLPHLNLYLLFSMCGGFMRRGVDFCSHYLRTISAICKNQMHSLGIFFVDIRGAFAVVMRALVFNVPVSDEYIAAVFAKLKFSPAVFDEFVSVVRSTSAMEDAKVPPNIIALIRSMSNLTFFHTRGVDTVCKYDSGTGAGTPLADVLFTFIMARVLKCINSRLVAAGLFIRIGCARPSIVSDAPHSYPCRFFGASYVDDNFFAVDGSTPAIMFNKSKALAPIVCDTLAVHCLPVNLNFGKTGLVFQQRGKGKGKLDIKLDDSNRQSISIVTLSLGTVSCFVYSDYKHVGSLHNDSCSYGQEVAARILSSRLAKKETCTLTNSRLLNTKSKVHLVKTFCISRLCVNVASIPMWTTKALTLFCKSYNSLFRTALLNRNDNGEVEKASNVELFSKHEIPNGLVHLRAIRLRYLSRLLIHGPPHLLHMISFEAGLDEPSAWTSLILQDLAWLKLKVCSLDSLPAPSDDPPQWFDLVKNYPSEFARFIRTAIRMSLTDQGPQSASPKRLPGAFCCTICPETFDTAQECSAHMFLKHGQKSSLREVIAGTICSSCMKNFHTRTKLHQHIAYRSAKCKVYHANMLPIDPDLYTQLEAGAARDTKALRASGRSILYHPLETTRVCGPLFVPGMQGPALYVL